MWKYLSVCALITAATVQAGIAAGQDLPEPYGPFDAIAEGAAANEARQKSLIDSQLGYNEYLRSSIVPVAQPRALLREPGIAAVVPFGRRGILGLRPQGYIVVRHAPSVVYRRSAGLGPSPFDLDSGLYADPYFGRSVRQPIGHQSLQTGPNRWEYRPLYADDDRQLDEIHAEIERNLQPGSNGRQIRGNESRAAAGPEELPVPPRAGVIGEANRASPARGQARDIARNAAFGDRRSAAQDQRVPPPPRPDPADQPTDSIEPRGPVLQDPSTGTREF